jgi:hypothetical protein
LTFYVIFTFENNPVEKASCYVSSAVMKLKIRSAAPLLLIFSLQTLPHASSLSPSEKQPLTIAPRKATF